MNKQDSFGRSPLHVAAAVDYVEMTEFLLENNANIDSKTNGDCQAPIHYAAKNGATRSLKMLLTFEAKIDTLDAKHRTPLQVQFTIHATFHIVCVLKLNFSNEILVLVYPNYNLHPVAS